MSSLPIAAAVIFAVTLAGGLLVLVRSWSDRTLHTFLAFGAGVILGAVFLHLLPELFLHYEAGASALALLIGFVAMFALERLLGGDATIDPDRGHRVVSVAALVGLSYHALFDGVILAVIGLRPEMWSIILLSLGIHKIAVAFSLGSLLKLARFSRFRVITFLAIFSLMTPLGALGLSPLLHNMGPTAGAVTTGIATGSFLYIATGELLPEVFHDYKRRWSNFALMIVGIVLIGVVTVGLHADGAHGHHHNQSSGTPGHHHEHEHDGHSHDHDHEH